MSCARAGLTIVILAWPSIAAAQPDGGPGTRAVWHLLLQALLSLAVVVGVIYLVYFGLRRIGHGPLETGGEGPLRLVQSRHLGGDRWLYVVEVEGRRVVVGAAGGHIAHICDLDEPPDAPGHRAGDDPDA